MIPKFGKVACIKCGVPTSFTWLGECFDCCFWPTLTPDEKKLGIEERVRILMSQNLKQKQQGQLI